MISYLPQIIKLIRTKKSEDISICTWIIWVVSSLSYLVYSFLDGDFMLIVSSALEFGMSIIILVLTLKYNTKIRLVEDIQ